MHDQRMYFGDAENRAILIKGEIIFGVITEVFSGLMFGLM